MKFTIYIAALPILFCCKPEFDIKYEQQILNKRQKTRPLFAAVAGHSKKSERSIFLLYKKLTCKFADKPQSAASFPQKWPTILSFWRNKPFSRALMPDLRSNSGFKQQTDKSNAQGDWIKGTETEQIKTIEKQFRGFDNAMVETGYRFQELYWAGQDENWEYANYQLDKIKIAIENGLERRQKRAKSAEHFLNTVLPEMKKSLQNKDTLNFNKGFQMLTTSCNNCHAMEKVPFFNVQIPTERQSPIKK